MTGLHMHAVAERRVDNDGSLGGDVTKLCRACTTRRGYVQKHCA
jgi:sulfur relay (sulfurtransferase) complex TusBCD TusD component (DsrE family)